MQIQKLKYRNSGSSDALASNSKRWFAKGYRVELYNSSFTSNKQVFWSLGHEYIEVGLSYNGYHGGWDGNKNDYAASKWEKAMGSEAGIDQVKRYTHGDLRRLFPVANKHYEFARRNNYFGIPSKLPSSLK